MKRLFGILLLTAVLVLLFPIRASAAGHGFDTEDVSEETKQSLWENIGLQLLHEEGRQQAITCFDIHADGRIALGFNGNNEKTIYIYDQDSVFLYGYRFSAYGDFGLCWNGDNITIYLVRSDCLITMNRQGDCIDVEKNSTHPFLLPAQKR